VQKDFAAIVRCDEAETLVFVEELDFAGRHVDLFRYSKPLFYKGECSFSQGILEGWLNKRNLHTNLKLLD
jgi:hypothetical protein